MMEEEGSRKSRAILNDHGFTDVVFSWSLEQIFNENLYRDEVEKIPDAFESADQYFNYFIFPLLEETRAQLCSSMEFISRAPYSEVIAFDESKSDGEKTYDVRVDFWRNRYCCRNKEPYKTLPGDILVLADSKPETVADLRRMGKSWSFARITSIVDGENEEDDSSFTSFKVKASMNSKVGDDGMRKPLFVVFLINVTHSTRIWRSLHKRGNINVIKETLCTNSMIEKACDLCSVESECLLGDNCAAMRLSTLNESQKKAVLACLRLTHCDHKPAVKLIWGPPGTGKTKTVTVILFTLFRMECRILTCAPTDVAISEVASKVLRMLKESFQAECETKASFCSLGDILLFGNKDRQKVGAGLKEIYLDYRVQQLAGCFGPLTGWRHWFSSMIDFLENCVSQYRIFLENELIKMREKMDENESQGIECQRTKDMNLHKSFLKYISERFRAIVSPLRNCVSIFCTHIPKSYILEHNFDKMAYLFSLLNSFETLLEKENVSSDELEELFSDTVSEDFPRSLVGTRYMLHKRRSECLSVLRILRNSLSELNLPNVMNYGAIKNFCFQTASFIFCTASSSYKLHSVPMKPLSILVVDDAAQLKECESTIPLQLPGIRHAVLIGDACQLPATVESKASDEAGFGRSLFERLSSLGHSKHLLNMQYRMHPSISSFPNVNFYHNQILDAPNVKMKNYEKQYLPGKMFGPYSFINVLFGREEFDDIRRSRKNMIEVAVVLKLLQKLHRAWIWSKQNLSVGVISPYTSQVVVLQEKLARKYENSIGFTVKVKSIDGFQGGEEDIIILSTVRANSGGSFEFISNPQRTNVALTRARHCLWILGNERALFSSESVWEDLVRDAKNHQCFFNANDDEDLAKAIFEVKEEFDQLDDLLNGDNMLFKNARWKVLFSDNFFKSFKRLASIPTKKLVLYLLVKLASGWRPKKRKVDFLCGSSSQILKRFKVEGLYVVCTIDIIKELRFSQVLRVWDILPLEDIPKLEYRLDGIFVKYADEFINRCKQKSLEGDLEIPKTWLASSDIVRFKNLTDNDTEDDFAGAASEAITYVENSKVSESMLLMKFYSLSFRVVNYLLSDRNGKELHLPFEVSDEELQIILFPRSTFVLGRSGTGKTTVLTMKLFEREQLHLMVMERLLGVQSASLLHGKQKIEVGEDVEETKRDSLRQLFVTVSPRLCHAVKQHISHLKSSLYGGNCSTESSSVDLDDIEDTTQFKDIPDSFVDVPSKAYPLVLTFHKFLMMLDGTLGESYFQRFHEARKLYKGEIGSLKSIILETFIRKNEVTYERFRSSYWPHFNTRLTKKLDSSRVFTEIMSHIKGGLGAMETCDGKIRREDYIQFSTRRVSRSSIQESEKVYDIFLDYEKLKTKNGEFDLADLVIDLHCRLRKQRYKGDEVNFVYVDEVQDLTISQISLFKYICRNVEEGFIFSGDTAQTIARGIDFRFQDIRSLFYNKFLLESRSNIQDGRKEKGQLSAIFNLSQNFRTHAGVLKLSQSIMELLYYFFPYSVDVLNPETSLIYGEPPVLLESGNNENAIMSIFGSSGTIGHMAGFGAEQVILVRDDAARKEIYDLVGRKALVLTILECKGLEFQDVLLYKFFGYSPLKNEWRVIYEYMREKNLIDTSSHSFPSFTEGKHNVLCSELKQLYVAITRTRQRLWVCENVEEHFEPMFDYWKKKCLVQVRQLDDSFVHAMQSGSSPEEWKSRGIKFFFEHNFEMATMCFEKAGDTFWLWRSKASSLKANADCMRRSNPSEANKLLREAAEIFEDIGRADSAAQCFIELGEYERAGKIYLEKCGEMLKAGECFSLGGCYNRAAEVYARGKFFCQCLSACYDGKLFDLGFQYIQSWGLLEVSKVGTSEGRGKIDTSAQKLLEGGALYHYKLKDSRTMMKFVKAFYSDNSMRTFLKKVGCLDELLQLEMEWGNHLEAANVAELKGDLLMEADILHGCGHLKDASMLILCYVFGNSLWANADQGWPLKPFTGKRELLMKAKRIAYNVSTHFYEFVCTEANVLSDELHTLLELERLLSDSEKQGSTKGEVLCARKILDAKVNLRLYKCDWEGNPVFEKRNSVNQWYRDFQDSVEELVSIWNLWKGHIFKVLEYLPEFESSGSSEYDNGYGEFCLDYFGVRKQSSSVDTDYVLLYSKADWVREISRQRLRKKYNQVRMDCHCFNQAAKKYLCSEVHSVGIRVLESLVAYHDFSVKNDITIYYQCQILVHIFQVSACLMESNLLQRNDDIINNLRRFQEQSAVKFFSNLYPLEWRTSSTWNMINLRERESRDLFKYAIHEIIKPSSNMTNVQFGKLMMLIFGSRRPFKKQGKFTKSVFWSREESDQLLQTISERLKNNLLGLACFENFNSAASDQVSALYVIKFYEALKEAYITGFYLRKICQDLKDDDVINWENKDDCIRAECFLYLVERLLILVFYLRGEFVTTRSSFVEWMIYEGWSTCPISDCESEVDWESSSESILNFVICIVGQLLHDNHRTRICFEWSGLNFENCYPLLVSRLFVIMCLIYMNSGKHFDLLSDMLRTREISSQLPGEFYDALCEKLTGYVERDVSIFTEAFGKIGNPLVIVGQTIDRSKYSLPDAILVDLNSDLDRERMLKELRIKH